MSITKDQILSDHFSIDKTNRLYRDKVKSIFNYYIPSITTRSLVDYLRSKHINYDNNLREFSSRDKGVFIGLKIIKDIDPNDKSETEDEEEVESTGTPINSYTFTQDTVGYRGNKLSASTINTWNNRLHSLQKHNINYSNYNSIVKCIERESDNLNTRITSLTAVLNALYQMSPDTKLDFISKLTELKKHWKQQIDKIRCDNSLSFKESRIWVSWDDIVNTFENLTNLEYKLILGLYVLHPPRRLLDYSEMYFIQDLNHFH